MFGGKWTWKGKARVLLFCFQIPLQGDQQQCICELGVTLVTASEETVFSFFFQEFNFFEKVLFFSFRVLSLELP
jgi:hypothetical protein